MIKNTSRLTVAFVRDRVFLVKTRLQQIEERHHSARNNAAGYSAIVEAARRRLGLAPPTRPEYEKTLAELEAWVVKRLEELRKLLPPDGYEKPPDPTSTLAAGDDYEEESEEEKAKKAEEKRNALLKGKTDGTSTTTEETTTKNPASGPLVLLGLGFTGFLFLFGVSSLRRKTCDLGVSLHVVFKISTCMSAYQNPQAHKALFQMRCSLSLWKRGVEWFLLWRPRLKREEFSGHQACRVFSHVKFRRHNDLQRGLFSSSFSSFRQHLDCKNGGKREMEGACRRGATRQ